MSWPAPIHTSRDPWPAGFKVPSGAATLAKLAEAEGWLVQLTYAQGFTPHGVTGEPVQIHSVAVRFRRSYADGRVRGGFVIYEAKVVDKLSWAAKSIMAWGTDHWPLVSVLNVTQAQEYVRRHGWTGVDIGRWRDELKAALAQKKEDAKAKAKARPKKAKVI